MLLTNPQGPHYLWVGCDFSLPVSASSSTSALSRSASGDEGVNGIGDDRYSHEEPSMSLSLALPVSASAGEDWSWIYRIYISFPT
jgi:hypothetical protein